MQIEARFLYLYRDRVQYLCGSLCRANKARQVPVVLVVMFFLHSSSFLLPACVAGAPAPVTNVSSLPIEGVEEQEPAVPEPTDAGQSTSCANRVKQFIASYFPLVGKCSPASGDLGETKLPEVEGAHAAQPYNRFIECPVNMNLLGNSEQATRSTGGPVLLAGAPLTVWTTSDDGETTQEDDETFPFLVQNQMWMIEGVEDESNSALSITLREREEGANDESTTRNDAYVLRGDVQCTIPTSAVNVSAGAESDTSDDIENAHFVVEMEAWILQSSDGIDDALSISLRFLGGEVVLETDLLDTLHTLPGAPREAKANASPKLEKPRYRRFARYIPVPTTAAVSSAPQNVEIVIRFPTGRKRKTEIRNLGVYLLRHGGAKEHEQILPLLASAISPTSVVPATKPVEEEEDILLNLLTPRRAGSGSGSRRFTNDEDDANVFVLRENGWVFSHNHLTPEPMPNFLIERSLHEKVRNPTFSFSLRPRLPLHASSTCASNPPSAPHRGYAALVRTLAIPKATSTTARYLSFSGYAFLGGSGPSQARRDADVRLTAAIWFTTERGEGDDDDDETTVLQDCAFEFTAYRAPSASVTSEETISQLPFAAYESFKANLKIPSKAARVFVGLRIALGNADDVVAWAGGAGVPPPHFREVNLLVHRSMWDISFPSYPRDVALPRSSSSPDSTHGKNKKNTPTDPTAKLATNPLPHPEGEEEWNQPVDSILSSSSASPTPFRSTMGFKVLLIVLGCFVVLLSSLLVGWRLVVASKRRRDHGACLTLNKSIEAPPPGGRRRTASRRATASSTHDGDETASEEARGLPFASMDEESEIDPSLNVGSLDMCLIGSVGAGGEESTRSRRKRQPMLFPLRADANRRALFGGARANTTDLLVSPSASNMLSDSSWASCLDHAYFRDATA